MGYEAAVRHELGQPGDWSVGVAWWTAACGRAVRQALAAIGWKKEPEEVATMGMDEVDMDMGSGRGWIVGSKEASGRPTQTSREGADSLLASGVGRIGCLLFGCLLACWLAGWLAGWLSVCLSVFLPPIGLGGNGRSRAVPADSASRRRC